MNIDSTNDFAIRAKRIKQVCLISILAIFLVAIPLLMLGKWIGVGLLISTASMFCLALWQVNKGNLDLAANIVVLVVSSFMLAYAWLNEGVRDEVLLVFPTMVTYSVLVGSPRIVNFLIIVVMINVGLIGLLVDYGDVTFVPSDDGLERAIPILIIFAATGLSIKLLGKDLRKVNKELMRSKEHLELRVEERTQELQKSIEQLKLTQSQLVEAEKMASLGNLVAGVAHQMNTPIGVVITASSHMQDVNRQFSRQVEQAGIKRSELFELLDVNNSSTELIFKNLQRVSALIDDFKSISVLTSNQHKLTFKLKERITQVIKLLETERNLKNVSINVIDKGVEPVQLDPIAFERVMTILIENSLTHGFEGKQAGNITITIAHKDQHVYMDYADDGIGISADIQQQIFDPFVTGKKGNAGTGLGMHIVYNVITQSFNGSIQLMPSADKGAHFLLSWPTQ